MRVQRLRGRLAAALLSAWLCFLAINAVVAETFSDVGFGSELVGTFPPYSLVGMAWAPDGRLFVWEKNGVVRVIKQGVLLPTPFIDLSAEVNTFDDRGFWGLAFHPDFSNNGYVYLSYVYEEGGDPNDTGPKTSRLTRVTADPQNPDVALAGSAQVILGSIGIPPCSAYPATADCIPADSGSHSLGTLRFAPDGSLFVGNGDGADAGFADPNSLRAQNLDSWSGKMLRIKDDGTAQPDNPFYDGTNSIRSRVWLYGVRNPFRFNLHPTTNDPYFGDVGWNTWEEINRGIAGRNYGWPCYEGTGPQPAFQSQFLQCQQLPASAVTPPLHTYNHSQGTAVIGGPIYTGSAYPQQYQNSLFFADYSGDFIQRMLLDSSGNPLGVVPFAAGVAAPVTVELGPDGMLYYLAFTAGELRRIRFNGPSAVAAASPSNGYSPLLVSFSSAGSSDPGGGALTFSWIFGDGGTSTLANPSHTYTATGVATFTATLTVRNPSGLTAAATTKITVGSRPPTPTISTPANGTIVRPGDTVVYQGSATDPEDGVLPASALKWTVLLHHNSHVHTFVGGAGLQGSFVAQDHGAIGTFSYEIILTATDSSGLATSTSVNLPVTAETTPPTAPSNLVATATGNTSINLSWTASTDNVAVTGYRVERCQGAGCTTFAQIATPAGTSFGDSGLTAGTSYSYRVRATDAAGNLSPYSNTASATTLSTPPVTGLVAAYAFNEGSGTTVTDASGNGNTGTISGATWSTQGRYGGALIFNGTNNRVQIPGSTSLNVSSAMTLEAWIYPTAAQSGWRTIMQREADAYFLNASNDTGPLRPSGGGTFSGATAFVSGTTANPVNAWTHVALTYDGATLRLYVNGNLATSAARTGAVQTNSNPLWIGGNNPYGEYFQGLIDDVRIYNRALTQVEIQTDMATPVTPTAPDTTPPTAPSNLVATATGNTSINLSWTASTDNVAVTGYRVERCQGAGCTTFAQIATPAGTSFGDSGLTAGISYSYRVRATDAAGNLSPYSNTASATTTSVDTTPPTAPSNLVATATGNTSINLSWTASTDNVAVTGYRVERCQGAGCTTFAQIATPAGTSFGDSGLTAGTSYSYRVRATDAAGNLSPYSNTASATTLSTPPVTGLVAAYAFNEGSGTTVTDASGNGNTGTISGATWSTQGRYGGALIFNGTNNRVQIPGSTSLNVSSAMTLEAWIYPTAAQSGWRTIMQREADAYFLNASNDTGPLRPSGGGTFSGATAFVSGTTANPVNAWTHVALTYDGATLRLYVNGNLATSAARTGAVQTNSNPLWIGGNNPYGEYFQGLIDDVRIYNRALTQVEIQTDMATPVTPTAPDTTPPTAPSNLVATATGNTSINLSWTASTDNVAVTGYRVERCQGAGCTTFAQIATPAGTSFGDSGLTAGISYSYRVRATDAAGNLSPYSNTASATTTSVDTTPPTAPSNLVATATGNTSINLSWTASTDNVAVTGYRVERCQGAGCTTFAQIATPAGTSFGDSGLTAGTSYSYRVRATDAAGNLSPYSNTASATTTSVDTTPPTAPSNLVATATGNTSINLSWTASTDNVAVTGYRVERCQGAGCTTFAQIATPAGTSFGDSGLTAGISYSYRVRATDAAGNLSPYSNTASATTTSVDTTPPTAPSNLVATATGNTSINLSWTASTDNVAVTGYRVERCQGAGCTTFAQIATPAGTSFGDSGLTAGTSYSYRVRATDAAGNLSPYSNTASATTLSTPPVTGLVAAYAFNEGSGTTVTDASGNGNAGAISGATWTTQGRYGGALSFNGVSNLVQIPGSASLNVSSAMTLEAWIYPTASQSGWRTIIQREVDAYFLNASNDTGPLRPSGGGTFTGATVFVSGTTANPINAWTHVALTYDGATLRLYVNGVQAATRACTGAIQTNTNPLRIGGNIPYGEYFQGRIDDVRVYSRALSQAEIQTDMNTPVTP